MKMRFFFFFFFLKQNNADYKKRGLKACVVYILYWCKICVCLNQDANVIGERPRGGEGGSGGGCGSGVLPSHSGSNLSQ